MTMVTRLGMCSTVILLMPRCRPRQLYQLQRRRLWRAEQQTWRRWRMLCASGHSCRHFNHDTPFTRTLYATADDHAYFGVQRH
ncbi:MAG: hypothetical protein R3E79_32285 [Caldilineaceae bacterium]